MIRLTDSQLDVVLAAARPLAVDKRDTFLQEVAAALEGHEIGDGILHRVIAEVQRRHYDPPLATTGGKRAS
jgi:hypothetical protein